MDLTSNRTMNAVEKAMDGHAMRHMATASNIANVDTPNYRKKTVSFEDQLKSALQKQRGQSNFGQASNDRSISLTRTHSNHFINVLDPNTVDEVTPNFSEIEDRTHRNDGNSVDVESEMANLARNTQRFLTLNNIESRLLRGVRTVIRDVGSV